MTVSWVCVALSVYLESVQYPFLLTSSISPKTTYPPRDLHGWSSSFSSLAVPHAWLMFGWISLTDFCSVVRKCVRAQPSPQHPIDLSTIMTTIILKTLQILGGGLSTWQHPLPWGPAVDTYPAKMVCLSSSALCIGNTVWILYMV